MQIDLYAIINLAQNLDWLESEFLKEDIDKIIAELPNNKSPGPDGFNGEFLKKCWPTLAQVFYDLCRDFFEGSVCLRSINSSYITLIPKKDCPLFISDFRPVSLLNSSIKLLTKLLADRLQKVIISLVHANQYGFIKSRSIQDCLAWAFEFIHLCKFRKKEAVILKLDFEKAFDKIEHQAILHILQSKGFGPKWLSWIKSILNSGTSSVLLNGVPGKVFQCKRGVRQGDPLSPLLFVLLQIFFNPLLTKLCSRGFYVSPSLREPVLIFLLFNMPMIHRSSWKLAPHNCLP
jgi:mannosylglycoprotein endo-beta-mannosidase